MQPSEHSSQRDILVQLRNHKLLPCQWPSYLRSCGLPGDGILYGSGENDIFAAPGWAGGAARSGTTRGAICEQPARAPWNARARAGAGAGAGAEVGAGALAGTEAGTGAGSGALARRTPALEIIHNK